jgi:hypothetical protein
MWLRLHANGWEEFVAYSFVDLRPLAFGSDSSFQNTAEYMAGLFCVHGMLLLGVGNEPCIHRGDSISSLTWTQKGTVRSDFATKPALMFAIYVMLHGIDIVGTIHLSHDENTRMDLVSRRADWHDVWMVDQKLFGGTLPRTGTFLDLNGGDLVHLLNPRSSIDSDDEFRTFLQLCLQFGRAVKSFTARPEDLSASVNGEETTHP